LYLEPRVPKDEKRSTSRRPAKPKSPVQRRRIAHLLLLFIASLLILDGLFGERGLLAMLRARHEYDELTASIARQRTENARLREQVRRLTDDPSAIEEVARRDLGLIKPGEKVFIIKDVPAAKP
jgi:cell division protein FtsB